jgi:hypothetical protein
VTGVDVPGSVLLPGHDVPLGRYRAAGRRFGTVTGCAARPLPAPEMPTVRLKARDRHGRTVG